LAILRPRGGLLREALRILPDALRLIRRLAADNTLPRGMRVRLALLLVNLAIPLDFIPDFVPVLGYADDAIIVTAVLRSVVRRAGLHAVRAHWPGSEDGFIALCRLTGLNAQTDPTTRRLGFPQRTTASRENVIRQSDRSVHLTDHRQSRLLEIRTVAGPSRHVQ
jgi:uncharacterized membrane protein YkvA (DUF1232 family)